MGASQKAAGGKGNTTRAASGHSTRGSSRSAETARPSLFAETGNNLHLDDREQATEARPEPRAGVESVPRDTRDRDVPASERAEAIRSKTPKRSRSVSTEPPRYSNRSARPRVIEAAQKMAAERGYDRLRLKHITDEAEISHQAFYGHFANKRHAVAVATSDELGAIADLAMRGTKQNEEWAERMLADIDKTLAATYPATDGPERWLRDRICEAVATEGGYNALRIIELIRVSKLGHGEFYRRYGGKRGCLQRIYGEALNEVGAEVGDEGEINAIANAVASDPERARLLILGASYLPARGHGLEKAATQSSLLELLADVVSSQSGGNSADDRVLVTAGGVLELIRSAVIGDSLDRLAAQLPTFELAGREDPVAPPLKLVA